MCNAHRAIENWCCGITDCVVGWWLAQVVRVGIKTGFGVPVFLWLGEREDSIGPSAFDPGHHADQDPKRARMRFPKLNSLTLVIPGSSAPHPHALLSTSHLQDSISAHNNIHHHISNPTVANAVLALQKLYHAAKNRCNGKRRCEQSRSLPARATQS